MNVGIVASLGVVVDAQRSSIYNFYQVYCSLSSNKIFEDDKIFIEG